MAEKLNQSDIAELFARQSGKQKGSSEQFVKDFFDLIADSVLEDGLVKVKGFGTFKKIEVADRESVNVNTGERFVIKGRPKITFTPDESLKTSINKPFAAFETITLSDAQADALEADSTPKPVRVRTTRIAEPVEETHVEQIVETPVEAVKEEPVVESTAEHTIETPAEYVTESAMESAVEPASESEVESPEESATGSQVEMVQDIPVEPAQESQVEPVGEKAVETHQVAEPVVEETRQETPQVKEVTQKRGTRILLKLLVWIVSIILTIAVLLYLFWPLLTADALARIERMFRGESDEVTVEQVIPSAPLDMDDSFLTDSIGFATDSIPTDSLVGDSIRSVQDEVQETVPEPEPVPEVAQKAEPKNVAKNAKPEKFALIKSDVDRSLSSIGVADTVNYRMVGTMVEHVVQEDETLTLISLHIYGTKKLWPYIAAYNKVKNPGSIHPGSKIRIPILENR